MEQVGEVERSYPWCGGSGYQAGFLQDIILTKAGVITVWLTFLVPQNILKYMEYMMKYLSFILTRKLQAIFLKGC